MKKSGDVFHIWLLAFYHSTDPVNELVSNIVNDEHFVFSLLDFPFKIGFDIRVVVDGGQGTHMKVFFERSVSHGMDPGLSVDGGAGSVFKGDNTTVTGQLFRIVVTGKEVGKNRQVQCGDLADTGHGGNQSHGFVEFIIGEDQFLDFSLDALYFALQGLVNTLKVVFCEFSQGGAKELQFVRVFVDIGTGPYQLLSYLKHDLDLFEDFWHGGVEFHFPMVFGGVNGDPLGIDPIVLSPFKTDASKDLDGHLHTEVGLFFHKFCDDQPTVDTGMFQTHQRVGEFDFLIPEQTDKGRGSFFRVFKDIRGSPFLLDDGYIEELFRYIDTDKAREVFCIHYI